MIGLFSNAPGSWRTVRLKDTITGCRNGTWGEEPNGTSGDSVCVRVADFDRLRLRVNLSDPTWRFIPESLRAGRTLRRGDLLLEKSGGGEQQPVGTVVLYDHDTPAVCSNFIARMPVSPGFDSRYLCYLHAALYISRVNCRSINQTTGIQNLDAHSYLSEMVRIPDFVEQQCMAEFLDSKTALLDHLMEKKQRIIELLAEQRRALLSSAVLFGLDPHSRRKATTLCCLGEIPEHWAATRLKFIRSGALLYGANEPATHDRGSGPRYVRITDLNDDGTLREDTYESLPEHLASRYLLHDGDILLARCGATVGKAFVYRHEWGRACFAGYLIRLRPDQRKILPHYLHYYTQTHAFHQQVRQNTTQSTIANVNAERYGNFAVPLPPISEQRLIVEFLDRRTRTLTALTRATERQVEKLHEYRSALIVGTITRGIQAAIGDASAEAARAAQDGV
ncbi:MAG: restriction modification system specificity domain protein [Bryobacterales bacterium]|nr:restriction modification system specificity domain protein [Bryobacterales bacterium]